MDGATLLEALDDPVILENVGVKSKEDRELIRNSVREVLVIVLQGNGFHSKNSFLKMGCKRSEKTSFCQHESVLKILAIRLKLRDFMTNQNT